MPPRLLVGPPGVGKTAHILSSYTYCEVLLLSTMTEEDVAGLPYHINGTEHRTEPPFFRRLREQAEKGPIALFLDEIDKARREVADTLLTLVASRKVGEWQLPDNCDIWAAANPPEWGGGDGVSQAMQSRFCVVKYVPDVVKWAAWCKQKFNTPVADAVADMVVSNKMPLMESNGEGWDWRLTCPRTLELAIAGVTATSSLEEKETIAYGLLTPNAASALMSVFVKATPTENIARTVAQRAAKQIYRATP